MVNVPLRSLYTFIGLSLVLVAWAFASPVGSSADEYAHLQRTYCYTGNHVCPSGSRFVNVPSQLVSGISDCWTTPNFQIAGNCELDTSSHSYTQIKKPFPGTYSSVFYRTMSLFYSNNIPLSVVLMRTFNSLLMAIVAAFSFHLLRNEYKYNVNVLILLLPNVSFFVASVNPTSWSIAAMYGLACSLISLHRVGVNRANSILALFSLALSFLGRPDAKHWSILVLVSAGLIWFSTHKNSLGNFFKFSSIAASVGSLIVFILKSGDLRKYQLSRFSDSIISNPLTLVFHNLRKSPQFISHIVSSDSGSYASSYLSKPFVIVLNCLILYLLVKCIQYSSVMVRALIASAIGLILFLINGFHFIWGLPIFDSIQPRYFLPILVVFFILMGIESNHQLNKQSCAFLYICSFFFVFFSIHTTLRRWSVGLFEFQKSGIFEYEKNGKTTYFLLPTENWIEHLKDLLFISPKWTSSVVGGNWTVLLIAVAGCLMLIHSMQRIEQRLEERI
jgi:hypothetical protein